MSEIRGFANFPEILKVMVNKDSLVKIDRELSFKSKIYDEINSLRNLGIADSKFINFISIFERLLNKWNKYAVFDRQTELMKTELAKTLYEYAKTIDSDYVKSLSEKNFFGDEIRKDEILIGYFANNKTNLDTFYNTTFNNIIDLLRESSLRLESQNYNLKKKVDLILKMESYLSMIPNLIIKGILNIGYFISYDLQKLTDFGFKNQIVNTLQGKKEINDINIKQLIYSTEFDKPEFINNFPKKIYDKLIEVLNTLKTDKIIESYEWDDKLRIISDNVNNFETEFFKNYENFNFNKQLIILDRNSEVDEVLNKIIYIYRLKPFIDLLKNQLEGHYIKKWVDIREVSITNFDNNNQNTINSQYFEDLNKNNKFLNKLGKTEDIEIDDDIKKYLEFHGSNPESSIFLSDKLYFVSRVDRFNNKVNIYKIKRLDPITRLPLMKTIKDEITGETKITDEFIVDDKIKFHKFNNVTITDSSNKLKFMIKNEYSHLNDLAEEYKNYFLQTYGLLPLLLPKKKYEEYDGSRGNFDITHSITQTINNARLMASQRYKKKIEEDPIYLYLCIDVSGSMMGVTQGGLKNEYIEGEYYVKKSAIENTFFLINQLSSMFGKRVKKYILGFISNNNSKILPSKREDINKYGKYIDSYNNLLERFIELEIITFLKKNNKGDVIDHVIELKDNIPLLDENLKKINEKYEENLQSYIIANNLNEINKNDRIEINEYKRKIKNLKNEFSRILRTQYIAYNNLKELENTKKSHELLYENFINLNDSISAEAQINEILKIRDKIAKLKMSIPSLNDYRKDSGKFFAEFEDLDEMLFNLYNSNVGYGTTAQVIEDMVLHEDMNKRGLKYFFVITDAGVQESNAGERWYNPISKKYEAISSIGSMSYWLDAVCRRPDTRGSLVYIYDAPESKDKMKNDLDKIRNNNISNTTLPTKSFFLAMADLKVKELENYYTEKEKLWKRFKELENDKFKEKLTQNEYYYELNKLNNGEKDLKETYLYNFILTYWEFTIVTTRERLLRMGEIENILKKLQDQKYFIF